MQPRLYTLYGHTALEKIKAAMQGSLQAWLDAWDIPDADLSLTMLAPLSEVQAGDDAETVLAYKTTPEKWVLFVRTRELLENIGSLLLHDNRLRPRQGSIEDGLVGEIVIEALGDLAARFSGERIAGIPAQSTVGQFALPAMRMPGSGVLCLQIGMRDFVMNLWISAELVRPSIFGGKMHKESDGEPALFPAAEALGRQTVPVQVMLGNAELTLDALCSLQVGDVIRLDENLSAPSRVAFAQSGVACKGFLGQKNGNLAVQLDSLVDG
jgi:flagellar motor switch/type III secretory pathway protein FliN